MSVYRDLMPKLPIAVPTPREARGPGLHRPTWEVLISSIISALSLLRMVLRS